MPDPIAATTTTETATPTAAGAAQSLAQVKAARRGAAPAAKTTTEPAPGTETGDARPAPKPAAAAAPPPVADKPPETAKIDMDPAALSQFTTLNRDLREARGKLKDAETKLADFGKYEKVRTLAKDGKHYDAAREAGIDVDAALAELLAQSGGQQPSAELATLKREIDALKTARADDDKQRAARTEADSAAAVKNDRAIAGKFVTENVAKYPHLAKAPELVDVVFRDFSEARTTLEKEARAPLSGDEQAKLMVDALAVHEEKWAKVFGTAAAAETPAAGFDSSQRAGVAQVATKLPERMTFAQVKAARRAAGKR